MTVVATSAPTDPAALERLLEMAGNPCVSIYLPTHRPHTQAVQDPVMLRNLIKDAHTQLTDQWVSGDEADRLLASVRKLVDDPDFWRSRTDGLALFGCDGEWQAYRLPIPVEADVIVGDVISLRQLAPLFEPSGRVMVLSVDQRSAQLFEADRWSLSELELPDLGVAEPHDASRSTVNLRRASAGPSDAAFFHGHGGSKEVADDQRDRFLREVERAVRPLLARRNLPVILGGDTAVTAALRPMLHDQRVVGVISARPDQLDADELHRNVWEVAAPIVDHARDDALARYASMTGTGKTVSGTGDVAAVAAQGRVDVLLLPPNGTVGHADDAQHVDAAMIATLRNRGQVVAVAADAGLTEPAAILRH